MRCKSVGPAAGHRPQNYFAFMARKPATAKPAAGHPPLTGYIEGYYGRLLRWEERDLICRTLQRLGQNTYFYAPKEDPLHRARWRDPYSLTWRRQFESFLAQARRRGVETIVGLAPGLSYSYTSAGDFRRLLEKMLRFADGGCLHFALLMDDIPNALPSEDSHRFSSLGQAHGELLQKLQVGLHQRDARLRLSFCPTVYCDAFAEQGRASKSRYLMDLAEHMPPIPIYWTGPDVISRHIRGKDLIPLARLFPNRLILWDNYYANDYCPERVFLGPLEGRHSDALPLLNGFLLNSTGLPHLDCLYQELLQAWIVGRDAVEAWRETVSAFGDADAWMELMPLLGSPFGELPQSRLGPKALRDAREKLKPLIWDWKGPLHLELYTCLKQLDRDLALWQSSLTTPGGPGFASHRFSKPLSRLLGRLPPTA